VGHQPVLEALDLRPGAFRPDLQEDKRHNHQRELDEGENDDRDRLRSRGRFPGDQVVQGGDIGRAGRAGDRADQERDPEPRLAQDPLRPALLLRLLRLGRIWRRRVWPAPAVQPVSRQQRADDHQRYPERQVKTRAGGALLLDGISLEHEHVQQADAYAHGQAAQQE
jgi:hypothetical protein